MMASNNMYRVGDFVYFETSASAPYQIRKIDELNKTATGAVEAKVICFYRRRDISNALLQLADKHQKDLIGGEEDKEDTASNDDKDNDGNSSESSKMSGEQKHRIKHRELFLSRQVETLPATHIRGKCQVTLHNHETENTSRYLDRDESFFYQLVYDPIQRTLLADKGEIRVGSSYQASVPANIKSEEEADDRDSSQLETLVWSHDHSLSGTKLDEYLLLARSVGTLARAYDNTSSIRQPNLLMSAAAASRDITKQRALDALFECNFNVPQAISQLIPKGGSTLFRDEMEEWSASEGNLFEEALEKYGKFFHDIHNDFLPWKTPKGIVEYYYMWKTTDHYVQHKRLKAAESEHKLKQVYIPNYNKPNPAVLYTSKTAGGCESCNSQSSPQWYSWGPQNVQCKLCLSCWNYWKRYGGLKFPSKIGNGMSNGQSGTAFSSASCAGESIGSKPSVTGLKPLNSESLWPSGGSLSGPNTKNRTGFSMLASPAVRVGRRLCDDLVRCKSLGRKPFSRTINVPDFQKQLGEHLSELDVTSANRQLSHVRLGTHLKNVLEKLSSSNSNESELPEILSREGILPKSEKRAFPRDEAVMERLNRSVFAEPDVSNDLSIKKADTTEEDNFPTSNSRKRPLEASDTLDKSEPPRKRVLTQNSSSVPVKKSSLMKDGAAGCILFMADAAIKKARRILLSKSLKKLTRCPWKKLDSEKYNVSVLGLNCTAPPTEEKK